MGDTLSLISDAYLDGNSHLLAWVDAVGSGEDLRLRYASRDATSTGSFVDGGAMRPYRP